MVYDCITSCPGDCVSASMSTFCNKWQGDDLTKYGALSWGREIKALPHSVPLAPSDKISEVTLAMCDLWIERLGFSSLLSKLCCFFGGGVPTACSFFHPPAHTLMIYVLWCVFLWHDAARFSKTIFVFARLSYERSTFQTTHLHLTLRVVACDTTSNPFLMDI